LSRGKHAVAPLKSRPRGARVNTFPQKRARLRIPPPPDGGPPPFDKGGGDGDGGTAGRGNCRICGEERRGDLYGRPGTRARFFAALRMTTGGTPGGGRGNGGRSRAPPLRGLYEYGCKLAARRVVAPYGVCISAEGGRGQDGFLRRARRRYSRSIITLAR
jgi:hypothetical protein